MRGSGALEAQQPFRYLKENTDYDTNMIVENMIAEEISKNLNVCRIEPVEEGARGFTVEKLLALAEETDYICVLNMPIAYPAGYDFGFIEYRDELCKEFLADGVQNLAHLFNVFSKDPMLGLVVAVRRVTLDYAVISASFGLVENRLR